MEAMVWRLGDTKVRLGGTCQRSWSGLRSCIPASFTESFLHFFDSRDVSIQRLIIPQHRYANNSYLSCAKISRHFLAGFAEDVT